LWYFQNIQRLSGHIPTRLAVGDMERTGWPKKSKPLSNYQKFGLNRIKVYQLD